MARWLAPWHADHVWGSVGWMLGGAALFGIGLAIWVTAFVLVPLGAILHHRRHRDGPTRPQGRPYGLRRRPRVSRRQISTVVGEVPTEEVGFARADG